MTKWLFTPLSRLYLEGTELEHFANYIEQLIIKIKSSTNPGLMQELQSLYDSESVTEQQAEQ